MNFDVEQYQSDRTVLMAMRSIYWCRRIFENHGFPTNIINTLKSAEINYLKKANNLIYYDQLNMGVNEEIDYFHNAENLPQNIIPDHLWTKTKTRKENFAVLNRTIDLLHQSALILLHKNYDIKGLNVALRDIKNWLGLMVQEEKKSEALKKLIDGLGFDE